MYSPMGPTFTGLTGTVNHIALAIASGLLAPWPVAPVIRGKRDASVRPRPGSGEGCPDLADRLATAEHGKVGDLVQGIAVHVFALIHSEDAQQRHRDGRDRPG